MNTTRDPAGLKFERTISILGALGDLAERLRRIAAWLQDGRRAEANEELQLFLTQLDRLIAALEEGPAIPLDGRELIAELRLIRRDIEALREPTHLA
jgi:hypothetical protein